MHIIIAKAAYRRTDVWACATLAMQVLGLTVLGVCFCYAMKLCCFTLTVTPAHVGGIDVKQNRPLAPQDKP